STRQAARCRLIPSVSGSRPLTLGSKAFGEITGILSVRNFSSRTRRSSHSSSVMGSASDFIVAPSGWRAGPCRRLGTAREADDPGYVRAFLHPSALRVERGRDLDLLVSER